ncbi:MAG: hypothetical protein ABEI96_03380 [Haloarculaceae archaeon]
MNRTIAIAGIVAVLLASGVAAAAPASGAGIGVSTNDHANAQAGDDVASSTDDVSGQANSSAELHANASVQNADDDQESDDENASEHADENASEHADAGGPPVDMPAQVPDHVVAIHEEIDDFLSGDVGGPLGHLISGLTPGRGHADDHGGNAAGHGHSSDHGANASGRGTANANATASEAAA